MTMEWVYITIDNFRRNLFMAKKIAVVIDNYFEDVEYTPFEKHTVIQWIYSFPGISCLRYGITRN